MIAIQINGDSAEAPAGETIAGLLQRIGRDPRVVAVERNGMIVKRDHYAETKLESGDQLEIVQFVQGG